MDGNKPKVGGQSGTMTLTDNSTGKSIDLPVLEGSVGPKVIDVRSLYAKTGYFTYDPGFMATAACRSSITYIDGDQGILMYRGYPIEQLAAKSDFLEVAYLLLNGELPTPGQKTQFVSDITHHTMVHEQITTFFRGFRRDAHPMAILCGVVGALSAFYHDSTDINDPYQRMVASHRLIAKLPTIGAMAYKYSLGQPFIYPKNSLGYAENLLHIIDATAYSASATNTSVGATNLACDIVAVLNGLWLLLAKSQSRDIKDAIMSKWLPLLLSFTTIRIPAFEATKPGHESRAKAVLALAAIFLQLQALDIATDEFKNLIEQTFDLALYLVDPLPEDMRQQCIRNLRDAASSASLPYRRSFPRLRRNALRRPRASR